MKFQIYKRWTWRGFRWYWRLRAKNGEIIAQSEGYNDIADCRRSIDLIIEGSSTAKLEYL